MLVVASSPAQAAEPNVEITDISSTNIASGEKTTLKYRVTNRNGAPAAVRIQVSGMNCGGDCSPAVTLPGNAPRDFTATLTAPQVDPGDSESVQVQVSATVAATNETGNASENVQVRGPDKPQTVRQISGKVRDLNGKAISGAQVILQDSADHKYETTSNNSGAYSFTSADDKPIAPGQVSIGAGKEGFKPAAISVNAAAGKSVNAPSLNLTSTTATPSPTPSTTEGASAPPLDETTDDATDPAGETAAATDPASNDSGSGSMLFIILGGLLVAAGVGAIVLVLMRRKGNGDGDDDADLPGGPIPPGQGGGRYGDATRVAAPVGVRANDATMVASMSGPPSISDAPTMLQRPVPADDEFPDPYGAPTQMAHGGYTAAAAGAYGAGPQVPVQGGYDDEYAGPATQYGRPVQQQEEYGGYLPPAADQRYNEQTGMYRPEPAYDPQPTGYDAGGYQGAAYGQQPQPGGYGQPAQPDQGYGWDAPAEGGNAYGPASGASAYGGGRAQASGGGAYGGASASGAGGAYGAPAGGGTYGGAPAGGGTYGGAPAGSGTYGAAAPAGTYGAAPGGYEVPAQRGGSYGGAPNYGADPSGDNYGTDQGGYDPRATYGRPADGYEQPPSRGGQQGGYGAPAGYDQGGYEQGGYDQGGYDQQGGGRHGGQARPEPTPPGQRRPVDWLDD